MQTFLTKTSQKKIQLLNLLLEENRWCSLEELQKSFDMSAKSILNYISELTKLLAEYPEKITLVNDNNQRFSIEKAEDFPIYTIYLHFYRKSYNYHLIDFMYHNPKKNLEEYAKTQFTSVSTVFRYAKLLVNYFKRYRMTFHTFKLELEADEKAIRSFYYYFYWNSNRDGSWPFDIQLETIEHYLSIFEKVYQLTLDHLQRRVFSYWLAIILERSQVAPVCMSEEDQAIIDADTCAELIVQWIKQTQLSLSKEEGYFLYQIIYSFGIIAGNKRYENSYAAAHEKCQSLSYRAVITLKEVLKQEFSFDLAVNDPELLFNFVAFHERSYLFFGNTDLFFNRSYVKGIKTEQPKNYQKMAYFRKVLKKAADQKLGKVLENWEQLFLNYYYVLDYYDLLLNNLDPIKILIQDDLHHTHRLWLMNKINAYFGHSYVLAFYDYQTKPEEVDLVVSNYYLNTKDTPLLLMKNIPTERNWEQLRQLLVQLMSKKS